MLTSVMQLQAKKSLGQHFLIAPNIHKRIVEEIAPKRGDVLIEIGPGTGLLTKELLARPLEKLIAFELDSRPISELRVMFQAEGGRFTLLEQDFLEANLSSISASEGQKLRVVGNIPYYITSPILFKLIDERANVCDATLLIQKEVAERLCAKPRTKEYGIPTVLANFFGEVKFLFKVPAGAFRPIPKVDSALVYIDFDRDYFTRMSITRPMNFDENAFRKLVRSLFAMRRKTIRNNLRAAQPPEMMEQLEANSASSFLNSRAEELTISDFIALYLAVDDSKGRVERPR